VPWPARLVCRVARTGLRALGASRCARSCTGKRWRGVSALHCCGCETAFCQPLRRAGARALRDGRFLRGRMGRTEVSVCPTPAPRMIERLMVNHSCVQGSCRRGPFTPHLWAKAGAIVIAQAAALISCGRSARLPRIAPVGLASRLAEKPGPVEHQKRCPPRPHSRDRRLPSQPTFDCGPDGLSPPMWVCTTILSPRSMIAQCARGSTQPNAVGENRPDDVPFA